MKQRTIAGLLAAVVLLAGVVIVQATRPAEAGGIASGGDPCPADIDNNGAVDVLDFLQLLADWGPCPAPNIVDVAMTRSHPRNPPEDAQWVVRIWSDGFAEYRGLGNVHLQQWVPLPLNPDAPMSSPVGVLGSFTVGRRLRRTSRWAGRSRRANSGNRGGPVVCQRFGGGLLVSTRSLQRAELGLEGGPETLFLAGETRASR